MMNTKEKSVPSFVEKVEGEKEKKDDDDEKEEISCDGDEEGEGRDDPTKTVEEIPQATDKKMPLPIAAAKKKQQSNVLNLNNEVVNMRKEVKRVRVLIIRKLTRNIASLKKKKGKEEEVERNQRRVARLLEEVHSLKNLSPDLVTKTALQKDLNFEQVCKNPKSTISDRAIARIATHPQFSKKIENIKAAIKAFKEERVTGLKQERKAKVQKQAEKQTLPSPDKKKKIIHEKNKKDGALDLEKTADDEEGQRVCEHTEDAADIHKCVNPDTTNVKISDVKDAVQKEPQSNAAEKIPRLPSTSAMLQEKAEEEESDVEASDDEEKEYFDDSTEERFHKQSSQSEESDDEDDFFVGKVSKFKKKKQRGTEKKDKEGKKDSADNVKTSDKLQKELDELETRLKSRSTSLQSVFCSSLTGTKTGRGRGGGKFVGRGKPKDGSGVDRDFSKQGKFQNKEQGASNFGSKYSKPCPEDTGGQSDERGSAFAGRGRERGRGRGKGFISHQPALHPSWEASKKRKEQQGQIMAFQGKKIKFNDDD